MKTKKKNPTREVRDLLDDLEALFRKHDVQTFYCQGLISLRFTTHAHHEFYLCDLDFDCFVDDRPLTDTRILKRITI